MNASLREYVPPPLGASGPPLPPFDDAASLIAQALPPPPELVAGLFRQGEKVVIGGQSKSMKSWAILDLALSVAHGVPWLGREVTPGRVLVVNLELPTWCAASRIAWIAKSRGINVERDRLTLWNLRGRRVSAEEIRSEIGQRQLAGLSLVVLDPIYKLLAGRDENKAGDIESLLAVFEGITADTGAALACAAHFAKGNAAGKEAMDRVSGSGVFARDPDSLLTLTRHEDDGAFAVEAVLRTLPPVQPFVVRWKAPVFTVDADADPARLKQVAGRPQLYTDDTILAPLSSKRLCFGDWRRAAIASCGISHRSFADRVARLVARGKVIKSATGDSYYVPGADSSNDGLTAPILKAAPVVRGGEPTEVSPHQHPRGPSAETAVNGETTSCTSRTDILPLVVPPPPGHPDGRCRKPSQRKTP